MNLSSLHEADRNRRLSTEQIDEDQLTLVRCHAGVKASEAAERAFGDRHRSAGREEGSGGVAGAGGDGWPNQSPRFPPRLPPDGDAIGSNPQPTRDRQEPARPGTPRATLPYLNFPSNIRT